MKNIPKELLRLQTYLLPENYLQWQERWEQANPEGFKVFFADTESYEEVYYSLQDDFKSSISKILRQFSLSLAQKRATELENKTGTLESYFDYGQALREILAAVRSSKITSSYAEFLDKSFSETTVTLLEKLDIDLAYNIEKVSSVLADEDSVSLKSIENSEANPGKKTSTNIVLEKPPRKKRGEGRIPKGGYKPIHPNPSEAIRERFKFLDRRICRVSTLSENEFEQFVRVTTAMIDQNTTITTVGEFAKAVNSEITYIVLTYACSDLKRILYERKRPNFYMKSMANLFGFNHDRFYRDFSDGELDKWLKNTFPKYEIVE